MVEVQICVGSSCHIKGSPFIIKTLQELIAQNHLEDQVELKASFCVGDCPNGVCLTIDGEKVHNVTPANVNGVFKEKIEGRLK